MSYHQVRGLGELTCAKKVYTRGVEVCQQWSCSDPKEKLQITKTGPSCYGVRASSGSGITIPVSVSASASASASTSTSTSSSASSSPGAPAATAPTTKTPTSYTQLAPKTLFDWGSYSKPAAKPASDYQTQADAASAAAAGKTGMNWLPWVLGAAGVVGVVYLVKRRG